MQLPPALALVDWQQPTVKDMARISGYLSHTLSYIAGVAVPSAETTTLATDNQPAVSTAAAPPSVEPPNSSPAKRERTPASAPRRCSGRLAAATETAASKPKSVSNSLPLPLTKAAR